MASTTFRAASTLSFLCNSARCISCFISVAIPSPSFAPSVVPSMVPKGPPNEPKAAPRAAPAPEAAPVIARSAAVAAKSLTFDCVLLEIPPPINRSVHVSLPCIAPVIAEDTPAIKAAEPAIFHLDPFPLGASGLSDVPFSPPPALLACNWLVFLLSSCTRFSLIVLSWIDNLLLSAVRTFPSSSTCNSCNL